MSGLSCPNCNADLLESFMPKEIPSHVPAELHNSNYPLCETQMASVRKALDNSALEMNVLDETISGFEHILAQLKSARQRKDASIKRDASALSPARRVPQDVWSYIFQIATDDSLVDLSDISHQNWNNTFTFKQAPLLLTCICRSWREIAKQTPSLWSTIGFRAHRRIDPGHFLLLQTFLSRSCSVPLTIRLSIDEVADTDSNLKRVYVALLMHASRWKVASLTMDSRQFHLASSSLPVVRFENLLNLTVTLFDQPGMEWKPFSDVPALEHLWLPHWGHSYIPGLMCNWTTITSLVVDQVPTCLVLDILRCCRNLKTLEAKCMTQELHQEDDLEAIQHTKSLEVLSVSAFDHSTRILDYLRAPHLTSLKFCDYTDYLIDPRHFLELADRLVDVDLLCKSYTFLEITDSLPRLSNLILQFRPIGSLRTFLTVIDKLIADNEEPTKSVLFPSLRKMTLKFFILPSRDDLYLHLCNSITALCRQISLRSKLRQFPSLQSIELQVRSLDRDCMDARMIDQLKELDLDCLEVRW